MNKRTLIFIIVSILILGLLPFMGYIFLMYINPSWSERYFNLSFNEFGDAFGIVTSWFTLVAFVAAAIAIFLQSQALNNQQVELRNQNKELRFQREELQLQRSEMRETRIEFQVNRATNVLFKQIELYIEFERDYIQDFNDESEFEFGLTSLERHLRKFLKTGKYAELNSEAKTLAQSWNPYFSHVNAIFVLLFDFNLELNEKRDGSSFDYTMHLNRIVVANLPTKIEALCEIAGEISHLEDFNHNNFVGPVQRLYDYLWNWYPVYKAYS